MTERFKVDLRGIIDLTANHLYSSPDVFVREVIQNAVDAIAARARIEPSHPGLVRFELTRDADDSHTICISDNGIGLTTDEVHAFLSTVGGSSKREDAADLAERLTEEAPTFLGRFGIGLLSCFMVTEEIVVITRSALDAAAPAVEWRGRADGNYQVRELPDSRTPAGTSVYLRSKPEAAEYFEHERLVELLRRYGEMLETPIVFTTGSEQVRINQERPPWELGRDDDVALADMCQHLLSFRPLDIFPIEAPAGGVRGYAFIRPDRSNQWPRSHRLYIGGMFVSEHVYNLMPEWATFVGCVLNSTGLRPTASREQVHSDDTLSATKEQLGEAVRRRLARLLRGEPEKFALVMSVHDTEIRGLAVKDSDFFDLIIDLLEFDTTLGRLRFGEFRREHDQLLIARTGEQFRRLSAVAASAGVRVFNGGYTYHEELLCRAAERHPELELRSFDSADLVELLPAPSDPDRFERLRTIGEAALDSRGCRLLVRVYRPTDVSAFFALGADAEFHRQLDRTKSMASGLWNEVLDALAPRPEHLSPTCLCLNADSPLIGRLASLADDEAVRTGVEVLYVQALMNGQHPITADDVALLNRGMERLLSGFARREEHP
ncbi:MAG: HSP90 family protein [Planctomycetes bacterium]|nr:HSP90 family protein [Planctomycetota bacterium]